MRKPFFILAVIGLVMAMFTAGVSCSDEKNEGEIPSHKIGDEWVWKKVKDDVNYTYTASIVGNETMDNKDCYAIGISYDPPLYEVYDTGKVWAAKSEPYFSLVKGQFEGTYMDMPASQSIQIAAEYTDGSPWPLEVGKEFTLTEVSKRTIITAGETDTESETETTTWKVESKEDVTVLAGTFNCFVIKKYDEDGEPLDTWWYSDEVKNDVKTIDAITGDTIELKSYSID